MWKRSATGCSAWSHCLWQEWTAAAKPAIVKWVLSCCMNKSFPKTEWYLIRYFVWFQGWKTSPRSLGWRHQYGLFYMRLGLDTETYHRKVPSIVPVLQVPTTSTGLKNVWHLFYKVEFLCVPVRFNSSGTTKHERHKGIYDVITKLFLICTYWRRKTVLSSKQKLAFHL